MEVNVGRMSDNGHKLKQKRFKLGIKKNFFTIITVKQWSSWPKDAVQTACLEALRQDWIKS